MSVYMFPGQGSQIKGMGADLFKQFPDQVNGADEILGFSVEALCLYDKEQQLGNTQYTQPALYVVEALSIMAAAPSRENNNFFIGHSLGEYVALFAGGAFDFVTGLKLVQKRGELMANAHGGGMLAVINLAPDKIKTLIENHELNSIDFANFNSNKQVILSGPSVDINTTSEILSKQGALCIPLRVSGAFHSRYMQSAANQFEQFIAPLALQPLQATVIANATALPYTDNHHIKENLVKQITQPVRWTESIAYLKNAGEITFTEIGPGNVLTRLMAQN
jgi:malonyl CoA-acyl carrier protein transacylase